MQKEEQPTYLYKIFEDTLNLLRKKISLTPLESNTPQSSTSQPSTPQPSTSQPSTPQPSTSQPSTPQPSTPQPIEYKKPTPFQSPLNEEVKIFATSIEKLKKIIPQMKGTKLSYMILRYEKEGEIKYI
jgi:hypothetical protein